MSERQAIDRPSGVSRRLIKTGPRAALLRLFVFAVLLAGTLLLSWQLGLFEAAAAARTANALGGRPAPEGLAVFILAFWIGTSLGIPATMFILAGGAVYGFRLGWIVNWVGTTLGAIGGYVVAHTLGRDAVRMLLGRHSRTLEKLAEAHGFTGIFRLRLLPFMPYNMLNFASGMIGVRPRDYVLGTALGAIPPTLVFTYFADALIGGVEGAWEGALIRMTIAAAVLILLSFLPAIWNRLGPGRRRLEG